MEYVYSLFARDIYSQVAVVEIAFMSLCLSVHTSISKNLFHVSMLAYPVRATYPSTLILPDHTVS